MTVRPIHEKAWGIRRPGPLSVEDMHEGVDNRAAPSWWIDPETGFFWASFGRWREFGFCAGRMRWEYVYAAWLMRRVKRAVEYTKWRTT